MKKLLITFSFFLFLACSVNAQFGVRAGVNLANISFSDIDEDIDTKSTLGFHFGITYDQEINEALTFRPGLLYSMKGAEVDGIDAKVRINYIEVPLDFSYAIESFNINAGPYLGYGLTASQTVDGVSEDLNFEKGELSRLDFGLNLGLSYNVNEMISVGAQYGLGLANTSDNQDGNESTTKNNVIAFFASYAF